MSPLFGSSDHVVLEIELKGGDMEVKQEESYQKKRKNYGKVNYTDFFFLFFFFFFFFFFYYYYYFFFCDKYYWTRIMQLKDIQEKYNFFLMIYERGVKKYI